MKRTNPLGPGTRNFAVNWSEIELTTMRREAHRRGLSLGQLIRHWVRQGISAELEKAN